MNMTTNHRHYSKGRIEQSFQELVSYCVQLAELEKETSTRSDVTGQDMFVKRWWGMQNVHFRLEAIVNCFQEDDSIVSKELLLRELQKCLKVEYTLLGKNHPVTVVANMNIATVLQSMGRLEEALKRYRAALTVQEAFRGKHHPKVALTHSSIGSLLDSMGDYGGAIEHFQKALKIWERVLGTNHLEVAQLYYEMGRSNLRWGQDTDLSIAYFRKAAVIQEELMGECTIFNAIVHHCEGKTLEMKGDFDGALLALKKSLSIQRKLLGLDGRSSRKHDTSLSLPEFEQVFATQCPAVVATYTDISKVLFEKGDLEDALEELHECLALQERILGPNDPTLAGTYQCIAKVLLEGKHDTACALTELRRALFIRERNFGSTHPCTTKTRCLVEELAREQAPTCY